MNLAIGITSFAVAFFGGNALPTSGIVAAQPFMEAQTVEERVHTYFADIPVMIAIAKCESEFRQFDKDGKVLKNPNSSAMGVFQIMASVHEETASKLGFNIYELEGNMAYARHLYEKQGTKPWEADKTSPACWGKTESGKAHFAQK